MVWHPNVYVYLKSFEFGFGVSLLLIQEKCKGVAKTKVQEKNVGINAFDFSDIWFFGKTKFSREFEVGACDAPYVSRAKPWWEPGAKASGSSKNLLP